LPGPWTKPDVVGIVAQLDFARGLHVPTPEQAHRPVAGACDREQVSARHVSHALRLAEAGDAVDGLSGGEVYRVHAAVAQPGHEQAPAAEVHSHVIYAPGNARQRDRAFQH